MSEPIHYAFPRPSVEITDEVRSYGQTGMTLRDWFAGQALAALVAKGALFPSIIESNARQAYAMADAMIQAREVQP
jgi:hypothetical protein